MNLKPIVVAMLGASAVAGAQQDPVRIADNPPVLNVTGKIAPAPTLLTATPPGAAVPSGAGETALNLNVMYTDGQIWNPSTGRYDRVRLRSYQGTRVDPDAPYVSPSIEVYPGETVRITLNNRLPPDPGCAGHPADVNVPHCFNGTNLHTHGLWVNPGGNGDNVLISINPGVSFQYEYKLPPDHPAGTFWYHTHRHGSTALQVSSGMAGALIVRGRRLPSATAAGDIDTLLRPTAAQAFTERTLVMQQIQYACRDQDNKIKIDPADGKSYLCEPGDVGTVEGYDQFGPPTWRNSGRYTSINGHVLPTFSGARTGKIERWRMVHAGVRDTISLQFRQLKAGASSATRLTAEQHDAYVGANCTGEPLSQHLIAADGLTLESALKTTIAVFQPGYRWDALLAFPAAGTYCVIDAAGPVSGVGPVAPSRQLLGFVTVAEGTSMPADVSAHLTAQLVLAAAQNMPPAVRSMVVADLKNGLKLARFVPHPTVADTEVTGAQHLTFNIDLNQTPIQFQVDGKPFDPLRVDRTLTLGAVDQWTLQSDFVGHPFHIHVNPFQIVKILDPTGKDVSGVDGDDTFGADAGKPDPQYRGMKGMWKDTLWVKNITPPPGQPSGKYTLVVRTRYERYIGDFVLHCHILDHEDQGMMQYVRIVLPGGSAPPPHAHR